MKRLKLNRWLISLVTLTMLLLVFQSDDDPVLTTLQTNIPDSDYFMQSVTVYQYNNDGSIANTLRANRMQHYIDKNLSVLTMPTITYNKSEQGIWILRSPKGEIANDVTLTLQDLVTIEEFSPSEGSESKITTSNLIINLQNNIAATSEKVAVVSPLFNTESNGFEFDFNQEIIRLTSNVKTEIYHQ